MKKTLALTLVAAAISAHAVSFTWNSNNVKVSFGGSTALAESGAITATLLYLGTDSTASIVDYTVDNALSVQSVATVSTGMASAKGKYTAKFDKAIGSDFSDGSTLTAGDYFTVLLTYTDTDSVTWYNLSSSVYQVPTDATDQTNGLKTSFDHSFAMNDRGTALTAGGGWTAAAAAPIPEPSTAALALAGLALLLKRRKA